MSFLRAFFAFSKIATTWYDENRGVLHACVASVILFFGVSCVAEGGFFHCQVAQLAPLKSTNTDERAALSWSIVRVMALNLSAKKGRLYGKALLLSSKVRIFTGMGDCIICSLEELLENASKTKGLLDKPLQDGYQDTLLRKLLKEEVEAEVIIKLLNLGVSLQDLVVLRTLLSNNKIFTASFDPWKNVFRFAKDQRVLLNVKQLYRVVLRTGLSVSELKEPGIVGSKLSCEKHKRFCLCLDALVSDALSQREALAYFPETELEWSRWLSRYDADESKKRFKKRNLKGLQ